MLGKKRVSQSRSSQLASSPVNTTWKLNDLSGIVLTAIASAWRYSPWYFSWLCVNSLLTQHLKCGMLLMRCATYLLFLLVVLRFAPPFDILRFMPPFDNLRFLAILLLLITMVLTPYFSFSSAPVFYSMSFRYKFLTYIFAIRSIWNTQYPAILSLS